MELQYYQNFADYILGEKSFSRKLEIVYYAHKIQGIFIDTSVIFKAELCRMFLEHSKPSVDTNLLLTASLLYACKKTAVSFDLSKVQTYARDGSLYLASLGFPKRFCKICLEVNRYNDSVDREPESDILEIVDNFGMLLDRDDRMAFTPEEATYMIENKNLRDKENRYLEDFKEFVSEMENITTLGLDKNRIISSWQKAINAIPKYDIATGINCALKHRNEARRMYIAGRKIEKDKDGIRAKGTIIQDKFATSVEINGKLSEILGEA